jgi:sugar lactone lactonase YvrE
LQKRWLEFGNEISKTDFRNSRSIDSMISHQRSSVDSPSDPVKTSQNKLVMIPEQSEAQEKDPRFVSRRAFLTSATKSIAIGVGMCATPLLVFQGGCSRASTSSTQDVADLIIGQRGLSDGRFQKPRAIAIDAEDMIYVVDKTGRIQKFDTSGKFLLGWRTPAIESGKPTGLSIDVDGNVMVADTHYYQFLSYTPSGELISERTIGGVNGPDPGQFAFVTDIVRTTNGEYYCGEYGEFDRIHKYTGKGEYLDRMGEHGNGPLQFSRPQSLAIDEQGLLWVADSCNHRIQVIDWRETKPRSVAILGKQGTGPGEFQYPYGMILTKDGMIVSEFGNHRVQRLDRDGIAIGSWGRAGNRPGELNQPWAAAVDSKNRYYVVDSGNNRVQRFHF